MSIHLIVVRSFDDLARGDTVTDPSRIARILKSEWAHSVVRVLASPGKRGLTSMPIFQQGSLNTTALVVPDLYVQIVPPQNLVLNGVPTNVLGVVGTSSWGPVGQPVIVATMSDYAGSFGSVIARQYDMGTQVATAVQQGAQNFRCVRVTDGTDTAAQVAVPNTTFTFTALYTGSLGNFVTLALNPGSQLNTWRLTIALPGLQPEVYDNIGGSGAAFWTTLATSVNQGQGAQFGPSQLVIASSGGAIVAPTSFLMTLGAGSAGSDGASGVAAMQLVGSDVPPRDGMYALRGQSCGIALLADATDASQWTTQAAFGLQEGVYMILTGPPGDTIQNAVTVKAQAGLDSYAAKLMFGDWLWWSDQINNVIRLVSPQGFYRRTVGESLAGAIQP